MAESPAEYQLADVKGLSARAKAQATYATAAANISQERPGARREGQRFAAAFALRSINQPNYDRSGDQEAVERHSLRRAVGSFRSANGRQNCHIQCHNFCRYVSDNDLERSGDGSLSFGCAAGDKFNPVKDSVSRRGCQTFRKVTSVRLTKATSAREMILILVTCFLRIGVPVKRKASTTSRNPRGNSALISELQRESELYLAT